MVSYFDKNEYFPGETARMVLEIDNSKCTADVYQIRGIFRQVLTLVAEGYTETIVIDHRTIPKSGIPAKKAVTGENALRLEVILKTRGGENLQPSCQGKLVSNVYQLCNQLIIDVCWCCDSDPSSTLKINIRNPDLLYQKPPEIPSNQKVQNFEVYSAQFSPEFAEKAMKTPPFRMKAQIDQKMQKTERSDQQTDNKTIQLPKENCEISYQNAEEHDMNRTLIIQEESDVDKKRPQLPFTREEDVISKRLDVSEISQKAVSRRSDNNDLEF